MFQKLTKIVLLPAVAAVLVACGGGGGGGPVTLTGVAAYGAPYPFGSKLTVRDAKGTVIIDGQEITSTDGSYSLIIPASAVAPLIISVSSDELPSLVSLVPEKTNGVANLTPITNLIASHLASSGNAADLANEIGNGNQITAATVALKTAEVKAVLAPLLSAAAVTGDPLTSAFKADGTGMDRVLDALKLDVIPVSGASNIVIGLKTALAEGESPMELAYSRGTGTSGAPPSLSSLVTATDLAALLAPSGVSVKINDWVKAMMACQAENIDTRVNFKNNNNATVANITSLQCNDLFLNADPSSYLSNGYAVTGKDHFSGIFWDAGTDMKISNAQLEYVIKNTNTTDPTRPMNGDIVFSYRWRTTDDKTDVSVVQGRLVNGKLNLTGNLSPWDVWVNPRIEKRQFTQSNMSINSYLNTGYSVYANANKHGSAVDYIKVTTPNGKILHLRKRVGYDYYVLGNTPTDTTGVTSVIRLASSNLDSTNTRSARDLDTSLFWGKNPDTGVGDWTGDQLAAIPNQGNWIFELYNNHTSLTLQGRAVRRTIARAPTIEEIKSVSWPKITAAGLAKIAATTNTTTGSVKITSVSSISFAGMTGEEYWSVDSTSTWLPTGGRISGAYYPGGPCSSADTSQVNWTMVSGSLACDKRSTTDDVRFRSNQRKITIPCSSQGVGHCEGTQFKVNNYYSFSTLWGFDSRRVENALSFDTRK
jgi:hypothetical protein